MASILKPHQTAPDAARRKSGFAGVAGFNLDDLAEAGVRHLRQVEAEGAEIRMKAQKDAEQIRHRAHEEGFQAGIQAGAKEIDRRVAEQVQREIALQTQLLESVLQQISDHETQFLNAYREVLVGMVLAASERLVVAKLDREPAIISRWAETAIAAARSARRIVVAVHPETLAEHGEALEAVVSSPTLPEDTRIEPDENVERSGVLVRCDSGVVDMTLTTQLERLNELLRADQGDV